MEEPKNTILRVVTPHAGVTRTTNAVTLGRAIDLVGSLVLAAKREDRVLVVRNPDTEHETVILAVDVFMN